MINRLLARLRRPERGWDPVPAEHAARYSALEWANVDLRLLDDLEARIGGLAGKTVLDLGGGPGHYSAAMAQRGARVTWHDVSARYMAIARDKAAQAGLDGRIEFSLGYLDEAPGLLGRRFDLVFNRICWYYGFSDRSFAAVLVSLVQPGGFVYADTTHAAYRHGELSASARLRTWLNGAFALKIGHPMPPRGRLARLFLQHGPARLEVDYRSPTNDRLLMQMPGAPE
ncbi:MAG: methyltransferase domain-containing protein [Rubrivivax sp.]|nr:methyltransferase domain-containing protein [Rubrivivax sp.]